MLKRIDFKLPSILDQFSDAQLIEVVPKIALRKIFWDDLEEGQSVTFEVKLSEKLIYLFILLTGSFNPLYYKREFFEGKNVVPATLIMGFISAVGGCYLGGENIFLVTKREAIFYSPLAIDSDTLMIRGTVVKKYCKVEKGKERYFADFDQKVYIKEGANLIKIAETGALAGILKKTRPPDMQRSELIPVIYFQLPKLLNQLDSDELRRQLMYQYSSNSFDELQVGDRVEVVIHATHKMIIYFALLSGDYNPLHTDPQFTRELKAFDGKNIAHGALLSAWFSGIGALELLGAKFRLVKKEEAKFNLAVKVGDEIRIELRIKNKFYKTKGDLMDFFVEVDEKLYIKQGKGKEVEAAVSGSLYELFY